MQPRHREIERALDLIWESSGGIALLQDMALLGHVYGHVDLVLRADPRAKGRAVNRPRRPDPASRSVSPTHSIAILDPHDYRNILAYVITYVREDRALEANPPRRRTSVPSAAGSRAAR